MGIEPGELCGHALCVVCRQCHESGCFCQHAMCDTAREETIFDVADILGFVVCFSVPGQVLFIKGDDTVAYRVVVSFPYTHQGMLQAESWLRGQLLDEQGTQSEEMVLSSLWQRMKRVVLNVWARGR